MEAMSAEKGGESQVERNASRLQTQTNKSKEIEVALRSTYQASTFHMRVLSGYPL